MMSILPRGVGPGNCVFVFKELTFNIAMLTMHVHLNKLYLDLDLSSISEFGGARGVIVIVVGIGHDDTSSNPGRD